MASEHAYSKGSRIVINALDLLNAIKIDDAARNCAGTIRNAWRKANPGKGDVEILHLKLEECKVSPYDKGAPTTLEQLTMMLARKFVREAMAAEKKK